MAGIALLAGMAWTNAFAKKQPALSEIEKAAGFAVQQEVTASRLTNRKDLCLEAPEINTPIREKALRVDLKRAGLPMHSARWCDSRGTTLRLSARATPSAEHLFEIDVELDECDGCDDFLTTLKKGTYVVRLQTDGAKAELVSYKQTCCTADGLPFK